MLNWFKRKSAPPQRSATEAARPDVGAPSARPADPVAESDALIRQGNLHLDQGRLALAAQCYREAVLHQPNSVQARVNLGFVLRALGQLPEAAEQLEFALSLEPTQIDALFLLGLKAQSEGDASRALEYLQRCHDSRPDFEPAIAPLCSMLQLAGRSAQAETVARAGLRLHPESADLHCVLAKLQAMRGLFSDALQNCDQAIRLQPGHAGAWSDRGLALNSLHQHEPARSSLLRALELEPDSAEAHSNLGVVLTSLKEHQGALAHVDRALALQPDSPQALHNRGQVLALLHRYEEAAQAYARLLAVAPEHEHAASNLLWARLCACNWTDYGDQLARLHDAVAAGKSVIEPWAFLALSDNAAMQLTCARTYAARFPAPASKLCDGGQRSHDKIRVAYLSADFHDHATSYLMAELFEKHDTRRFSFTAISFGPASGGAMRERLARSFGAFIDVRDKSDLEAARLIRDLEIDIAVDLKGYTTDARPGILAHRPAPIQVNYLGYPGTLGADCIDYLIADRRLIPPDHHLCYSEKIVYMPDSYQVNDSQRRIGGQPISRLDAGLPQQGFVFCCFNNNYKIGPPMFQVWMNLLRRVPGSVLWLLEDNPAAVRNLRSAAKRQGIAPERLVFAPRIPLEAHLARHALADLFLDTLPCNAHTTASDSLWAGLPVLTCLGSTFAGRVAASLLDAVGLPELVAADLDGYEAMALALATQADRLAQVRDRLAVAHGTSPLFDSGRFARHLESAYASMWERQQLGLPPTSFAVVPASI